MKDSRGNVDVETVIDLDDLDPLHKCISKISRQFINSLNTINDLSDEEMQGHNHTGILALLFSNILMNIILSNAKGHGPLAVRYNTAILMAKINEIILEAVDLMHPDIPEKEKH